MEAEARGQYEILAKKGEGLKQIIEACGSADKAYQLLMLEHLDKLAETSALAISNIKFDKIVVWEGGGANGNGHGNGHSSAASFVQNMARMMPPIMQVVKDIGGVELPGFLGKTTEDPLPEPIAARTEPVQVTPTPPTNGGAAADKARKPSTPAS